ncbi:hypothetical protein H2201_001201 [Coniosporium apollinis]|uniref:Lipase B n=1 Tax=Coniosporium apollinis TaxID=61459 RepID=A0ABQ9P1T5_9PEZI|nr:hypothetical protein H2201_001201 [Coniosporium apollinis]
MAAAGVLLQSTSAAPTGPSSAAPTQSELEERQLLRGVAGTVVNTVNQAVEAAVDPIGQIRDILSGVGADTTNAAELFKDILDAIDAAVPTATTTSIEGITNVVEAIFDATPTNLYENVVELAENSLAPGELGDVFSTYSTGINSENNVNTVEPAKRIFPEKSPDDAPYSLAEADLRRVIYIPSTFTYGKKPPVILVPGTGSKGGITFGGNYIQLLTGVDYADPVWLNIPGFLLDDAQINAEYVEYAINYISGITKRDVSVIAWSQGNLDTQWALKYWPSTRKVVSDFINISPDFYGTRNAYAVCPRFSELPCPPSVIQQVYESNFIATFRADGGDSAYVPTTSIYSATDEIVQPQSGPDASAIINDARGVGATNNELQVVCNDKPAGSLYTHEGVL